MRDLPDCDKFTCTECGEESFQYIAHNNVCGDCEFVRETIAKAKTRCGTVAVPRYSLLHLPGAVSRLRNKGWDLEISPRTGPLAFAARLSGVDDIDITLRPRDVSLCKGRPVARHDDSLPTPCTIQQDKLAQCATCPMRTAEPKSSDHQALLRRCIDAVGGFDTDAVTVNVSNREIPLLVGLSEELEGRGWHVHINAFQRFPSAKLELRPSHVCS